MRELDVRIVPAAEVRRSLTRAGDIRAEIGFQNDINALLARFDEVRVPWQALAGPTPTLPLSVVADTTPMPSAARPQPAPRFNRIDATVPRLRVLDGGVAPTLGLLTVTVAQPQRPTTPTPSPAKQPRPAAGSGAARAPRRRA
jgi:hypothetical protein